MSTCIVFLAMYTFGIVTMRLCVQRNTSPKISKLSSAMTQTNKRSRPAGRRPPSATDTQRQSRDLLKFIYRLACIFSTRYQLLLLLRLSTARWVYHPYRVSSHFRYFQAPTPPVIIMVEVPARSHFFGPDDCCQCLHPGFYTAFHNTPPFFSEYPHSLSKLIDDVSSC